MHIDRDVHIGRQRVEDQGRLLRTALVVTNLNRLADDKGPESIEGQDQHLVTVLVEIPAVGLDHLPENIHTGTRVTNLIYIIISGHDQSDIRNMEKIEFLKIIKVDQLKIIKLEVNHFPEKVLQVVVVVVAAVQMTGTRVTGHLSILPQRLL